MKPLTNETLIESFNERFVYIDSGPDGDGYDTVPDKWVGEFAQLPPEEQIDGVRDFILSALQAKEEDMVEKFKEMIGKDEDSKPYSTDLYQIQRNKFKTELRSKLSNLSEKKR